MLILSISTDNGSFLMSVPRRRISPFSMSQNLASKAAIVDFPPPEGPTSAVIVPLSALSDMPYKITCGELLAINKRSYNAIYQIISDIKKSANKTFTDLMAPPVGLEPTTLRLTAACSNGVRTLHRTFTLKIWSANVLTFYSFTELSVFTVFQSLQNC